MALRFSGLRRLSIRRPDAMITSQRKAPEAAAVNPYPPASPPRNNEHTAADDWGYSLSPAEYGTVAGVRPGYRAA